MEHNHEFVFIQASIYHGRQIWKQEDRPANWLSNKIYKKNAIKVEKGSYIDTSKEGLIIRKNQQ